MGKKSIELITLQAFYKMLKREHMTKFFKFKVNSNNISTVSKLYQKFDAEDLCYGRGENPFTECATLESFIATMRNISKSRIMKSLKDTEDLAIQKRINEYTNLLLHVFIEQNFVHKGKLDIAQLEKLGKKVFDEACKEVLGENFEDKMILCPQEQVMSENDSQMLQSSLSQLDLKVKDADLEEIKKYIEAMQHRFRDLDIFGTTHIFPLNTDYE